MFPREEPLPPSLTRRDWTGSGRYHPNTARASQIETIMRYRPGSELSSLTEYD